MVDLPYLPPMDLIVELSNVAEKVNRKSNPLAFKELSDLVSVLVAASAGEPKQMLDEIVIRDQVSKLSKELDQLLLGSSYQSKNPGEKG